MANWWPEGDFWVGPLVVLLLAIIVSVFGQAFTTRISFDVLENCHPEGIKESFKNMMTNIGVTSALVLTMVVAMIQEDPIEPLGLELEDDQIMHLQQFYQSFCIAALLFNMLCILMCVINLTYVDPLTETDAVKFFLTNADSIGDPVVLLAESCICFMAAIFVWILGTYGVAQGVVMALCLITFCIFVGYVWKKRAAFNPGASMEWTQDTALWTSDNCTPGLMARKNNQQVTGVVKRLGKVVLDSQADSWAAVR